MIFIDITEEDFLTFILEDGDKVRKKKIKGQRLNLLFLLSNFLKDNKLSLKKIKALILLEGGGSFSGVRQSVAILNMIHLFEDKPILGLDKRKLGDNWDEIKTGARKKLLKYKSEFIKPIYSGEPNITRAHNLKLVT